MEEEKSEMEEDEKMDEVDYSSYQSTTETKNYPYIQDSHEKDIYCHCMLFSIEKEINKKAKSLI